MNVAPASAFRRRAASAGLALSTALALSACDLGDGEPAGPTDGTAASPTEDDGAELAGRLDREVVLAALEEAAAAPDDLQASTDGPMDEEAERKGSSLRKPAAIHVNALGDPRCEEAVDAAASILEDDAGMVAAPGDPRLLLDLGDQASRYSASSTTEVYVLPDVQTRKDLEQALADMHVRCGPQTDDGEHRAAAEVVEVDGSDVLDLTLEPEPETGTGSGRSRLTDRQPGGPTDRVHVEALAADGPVLIRYDGWIDTRSPVGQTGVSAEELREAGITQADQVLDALVPEEARERGVASVGVEE